MSLIAQALTRRLAGMSGFGKASPAIGTLYAEGMEVISSTAGAR